jgi:pimeloyl-ACP methyl ester carboxylesterase
MDLIELSGYRLAIEAEGDGDPPVVFVPALGWTHSQWDQVRAELAVPTTTIVYNRPGLGGSDPLPSALAALPLTTGWAAEQLNALLNKANVPSPRILVGHSIGGVIAERYASSYPDDIAGLVLLDRTYPPLMLYECDDGLILDGDEGDGGITFDVTAMITASDDSLLPASTLPCVVVSRALGAWSLADPDSFAPTSLREIDAIWQEHQRRLAARYDGQLIVTHFSDHLLPTNVPELVAQVIDAVVNGVRQRRPVTLDLNAIYDAGGRVIPVDER